MDKRILLLAAAVVFLAGVILLVRDSQARTLPALPPASAIPRPLVPQQGTLTPTPVPTFPIPCGLLLLAASTSCTAPATYYYSFAFYIESGCPASANGTATVRFELAATAGGPWTSYDQQTFPVTYTRPGVTISGSFTESNLPPQYPWYRFTITAEPGYGIYYAWTNATAVCGPLTPTATPTVTLPLVTQSPTRTPTGTPAGLLTHTPTTLPVLT